MPQPDERIVSEPGRNARAYRVAKPQKMQKKRKRGLLGLSILYVLIISSLLFALWSGYFFWKIIKATSQITGKDASPVMVLRTAASVIPSLASKEHQPLRGEEDGRINILLLGKATPDYPGRDLTDTIMIASVDLKTMKVALFSLPRDLYVRIPRTELSTKINALYQQGLNESKRETVRKTGKKEVEQEDHANGVDLVRRSVEDVVGSTIHYYAIVDYAGFTQVIDAMGGVNVNVERDILDTRYPGPNYSYQTFKLDKGLHTLDGATALKYVRERHSDPLGDFGRAYRQQQVIEAVKNKALSAQTFLNPFALIGLLNAAGDNIRTDITPEEIESFIDIARGTDTQNIGNIVIDAWRRESLLRVSHVELDNGQRMFALVPRSGNYSEIHEAFDTAFNAEEQEQRAQKIQREDATVAIINYSGNSYATPKISDLLEDIGISVRLFSRQTDELAGETVVADRTGLQKPFSLDEIVKRIPAVKTDTLEEAMLPSESQLEDADFIVIVGTDTTNKYNWKEVSPEEYTNADADDASYVEEPQD